LVGIWGAEKKTDLLCRQELRREGGVLVWSSQPLHRGVGLGQQRGRRGAFKWVTGEKKVGSAATRRLVEGGEGTEVRKKTGSSVGGVGYGNEKVASSLSLKGERQEWGYVGTNT